MIKHLDLFSGIGGFALAIDRVFPNAEHTFCEIDPFCQEVLKKHWPNSKIYEDIRIIKNTIEFGCDNGKQEEQRNIGNERNSSARDGTGIYILTGGFPCQPFSQAGRRKGTDDNRYLWPEMLRVIKEFRPEWVIAENVRGLLTIQQGVVFEQVCLDLEDTGYEVQPLIIPAVAVNAPHRRDRVWFVAHRTDGRRRRGKTIEIKKGYAKESRENGELEGRLERPYSNASDINTGRKGRYERKSVEEGTVTCGSSSWEQNWLEVATRLCRVDDGLPRRMDRNPRLKALGNAIVPQVAEEILKEIKNSI